MIFICRCNQQNTLIKYSTFHKKSNAVFGILPYTFMFSAVKKEDKAKNLCKITHKHSHLLLFDLEACLKDIFSCTVNGKCLYVPARLKLLKKRTKTFYENPGPDTGDAKRCGEVLCIKWKTACSDDGVLRGGLRGCWKTALFFS